MVAQGFGETLFRRVTQARDEAACCRIQVKDAINRKEVQDVGQMVPARSTAGHRWRELAEAGPAAVQVVVVGR